MTKYNWDERHIITFPEKELALEIKDLHVYYGQKEAIKGIDMQFEKNKITALIGPSGCGKSTFLRSLNRMNDTIDIAKVTGQILYQGVDVNASNINVYEMRKHIGMVFQRPNPFAKSIYRNITFAHERKGVSKPWTRLLKHHLSKLDFGIKLKMTFINLPLPFQVASNNVFVLQELLL